MPIMVKDNCSVLFIHIPKCGGSSFEKSMAERGWKELLSVRGINSKQLNFLYCSPQHLHADPLQLLVRPENVDHVITIVRDPLARLKSEYAWQLKQSITSLPPEAWIEHVFVEYEKNPYIYDNHIRPQHEFILPETKVYKLEENGIDSALEDVSPLQLKPSIFNALKQKKIKHLKKTDKASEIHEAFEQKLDLIRAFYMKDYELFNYSLNESIS